MGFSDPNSLFSRANFQTPSQWTLEPMPSQIVTSGFGPQSRSDQFRTGLTPQFPSISNRQRFQFQNPRSRQTNRNFLDQQQQLDLQRFFSSPSTLSTEFVNQNQGSSQNVGPSFWDAVSNPMFAGVPNQIDMFQTGAETGFPNQIEMNQNQFDSSFNPFLSNNLDNAPINDQQMIRNGLPGLRNDPPNRQNNIGTLEGDAPRWLSNIPQGIPSSISSGNRNNDSTSENTPVSRDGIINPRNRSDITNLSESFERFNRGNQDFRRPNMLGNNGPVPFLGNQQTARENLFGLPPRRMGNLVFGRSANDFNTADNLLFSG